MLLKPHRHNVRVETMVFELCEVMESLCVETLGTVTAEFHEDARATSLAADSVSLTVE